MTEGKKKKEILSSFGLQLFTSILSSFSYFCPMKLRSVIFLLLIGGSIVSCSEIRKKRSQEKSPELKSFLFRTDYFVAGDDLNFSFPVWFNDSLVAKEKIKTIVHRWYSDTKGGESGGELQKIRRYTFDESGILISVQQQRYYENIQVENITFKYKEAPDALGYATLKAIDSLHPEDAVEYITYSKDTYHDAYAVYENDHTGDFLFCLLNKRYQEIVTVDSLFGPTPDDIVQYGKPSKPYKRFQIENLVEEKQVSRYRYFKESSELRYRRSESYPFSNKTYVTVGKDGSCTGFIDSTFSAGEYLNRTVSTFSYNKRKLPNRLAHKGMRNGKYETFEYSFY
ncbi:MAG: hypothetical protein DCO96_00910 [Fluviicola sp. XM-24bin1]|nr:MAG: hypothetical protein DCO96_00910 [Fluviicola sp. XM-24bin1]